MDVSFADDRLAQECNSATALQARWGDHWVVVGRRLLEIAALEGLEDLAHLPHAQVRPAGSDGIYDVQFEEGTIIRLAPVDVDGNPVTEPASMVAKIQIVSVNVLQRRAA